jgi:hypothetical protein
VGKNKEKAAQYILHNRESINEEPAALNASQRENPEQPEERLVEVDDSIFEEAKLSRCAASIKSIAEVDPMGACLLIMLSKQRLFNHDA